MTKYCGKQKLSVSDIPKSVWKTVDHSKISDLTEKPHRKAQYPCILIKTRLQLSHGLAYFYPLTPHYIRSVTIHQPYHQFVAISNRKNHTQNRIARDYRFAGRRSDGLLKACRCFQLRAGNTLNDLKGHGNWISEGAEIFQLTRATESESAQYMRNVVG